MKRLILILFFFSFLSAGAFGESGLIESETIPVTITVSNDTLYCHGNNKSDLTYQWFLNDKQISGATLDYFVASFSGLYQVRTQSVKNGYEYSDKLNFKGGCAVDVVSFNAWVCPGECSAQLEADVWAAFPVQYYWTTGDTLPVIYNLCSGYYGVTIVDGNGCISSGGGYVSTDSVTFNINVANTTCIGCTDGTIDIDVTSFFQGISYSIFPDTGLQNGNHFSDLPSGIYMVCVVDENSCSSCIADTVFEYPTSIENSEIDKIEIYPNPAFEHIVVSANDRLTGKEYAIVNAIGEIVCRGFLTGKRTSIPIDGLTKGIYFVKIKSFSQAVYSKLVKL